MPTQRTDNCVAVSSYIVNGHPAVPFEQLGFKTQVNTPLPMLTWNALSNIPTIVSVSGVFLYGIWWITNRRSEVERVVGEERKMAGRKNGGARTSNNH